MIEFMEQKEETWALAMQRKVALSTRPRNIRELADEVS